LKLKVSEMKTQIITLFLLLIGISLVGQERGQYLPDTVLMKSGDTIPCKIASIDLISNNITFKYYDEQGVLTFEPMPFDDVKTYVLGTEAQPEEIIPEEKEILPYDSLKSIKAYLGFGGGYPRNAGLSFTVILKNDWGGSISVKHTSFDKKDQSGKAYGIWGTGSIPGDEYTEYSLCVVREFRSKTSKRVRFGLEGGPSLVYYEKVESYFLSYGWFFGSYYSAVTSDYTTVGLALRTKIEFPVSLGFGLEIALYGNINQYRPHAGFEIYLTVGKVRDRLTPRKNKLRSYY
jgi:hypothetical protein